MAEHAYTPADSLRYLANCSLLDVALDALEDEYGGGLQQRVELACEVIRTARKIIAHEACYHGLHAHNHYGDGTPVMVTYEESYREQDAAGMWHVGTREVVATRHPSGSLTHPVVGNPAGGAA